MAELSNPCPWVPEVPFFIGNRQAVKSIFTQLEQDFPESGAGMVIDDAQSDPSPEAMNWMWSHLMGRQHGSSEGFDGKIPLTAELEKSYRPAIGTLHYGPYSFTQAHPADSDTHYTHSLVLGGFPQEMVSRLRAARGKDPRQGNVDASTLLVGQRLRWSKALGERSLGEIYKMVGKYSGTDMDRLRERSPWIQKEERKTYDASNLWAGPYATEFELGRLCTEAYFHDLIDWANYDVRVTDDLGANEQKYNFRGSTQIVPPRTESLMTYDLIDGTKAHILNARAVARTRGVPRPTSDSQAVEVINLGIVGQRAENISIATSLPHIRGGIDIVIRLLEKIGPNVSRTEIVSHPWLPDKEILAALGEIPATHKADLRLRAALAGNNPDAPELTRL